MGGRGRPAGECLAGGRALMLGGGRATAGSAAGAVTIGDRAAALPSPRVLPRRRPLLNARAAVGGLLVAAAAVGTFATYSGATADHRVAYVVAARQLVPGQRLNLADLTTARMQLPASLADTRAFRSESRLLGAVVVAPVAAGELIQASEVVGSPATPYAREMSFAVDPSRAVDGTLQPGETVEVLATYGTGQQAVTSVVVPVAHVIALDVSGGAFSSRGLDITLGLDHDSDVVALVNAVNAGQIELVRADRQGDRG